MREPANRRLQLTVAIVLPFAPVHFGRELNRYCGVPPVLTDAGAVIEDVGGGADKEWRRCASRSECLAPVAVVSAVEGGTAPDEPLFIGSVAEELDGIASGEAD